MVALDGSRKRQRERVDFFGSHSRNEPGV
jgi:hypothetical protein